MLKGKMVIVDGMIDKNGCRTAVFFSGLHLPTESRLDVMKVSYRLQMERFLSEFPADGSGCQQVRQLTTVQPRLGSIGLHEGQV